MKGGDCMPDEAKRLIHQLTNQLQAVLGYLELGEYRKMRDEIKGAIHTLKLLRLRVNALCTKKR